MEDKNIYSKHEKKIEKHHEQIEEKKEEPSKEYREQKEGLSKEYRERKEERRERYEEYKEFVEERREEINALMSQKSLKDIIRGAFSIKADTAEPEIIRERILSGGKVTGTNMVIMICAIMIASVGLTVNSTAVIIGAMLVSPLMGSILALAYGSVTRNPVLLEKHGTGFILQIVVSLLTSTLYFMIAPIHTATPELLARTSPSFYDVLIATFGGIAGIIGQTREDKANTVIPGVAIATALMPPICTCGFSMANGNWDMFKGAGYLFIINCYFIYSAAEVVLAILDLPEAAKLSPEERKKFRRRKYRTTFIVLLPCIAFLFSIHMQG